MARSLEPCTLGGTVTLRSRGGVSVVVIGPGVRVALIAVRGRVDFQPSVVGAWSYEWDTGTLGTFDVVAPSTTAAPAGVVEPG